MLWPTGPTRFDPAGRPRATSGASRDEKVMSASPSTRAAAITTTAAMSRPIPVPGVPSLRFPDLLLLLECPIAPRPSYPHQLAFSRTRWTRRRRASGPHDQAPAVGGYRGGSIGQFFGPRVAPDQVRALPIRWRIKSLLTITAEG